MAEGTRRPEELTWDTSKDGLSGYPIELVSPIDWEVDPTFDDGDPAVRIHLDRLDRDTWYKPRVRPILEGLEQGLTMPEIARNVQAVKPDWSLSQAGRLTRRIIGGLAAQGNVEIRLPPVPEVFGGRFERQRELGRGGVGIAWLCEDMEQDGAPVVVKHAWNWSGPLEARDQALRDEAALLAPLDHPAVVELVSTLEIDGRFHMAREYIDGQELETIVLRDGAPAPEVRIGFTQRVASLLDHLHEHGVLCLDLKPSNLMIEAGTHRLVLSDLSHGRSFEGDRLELDGPWGTQAFASPEVLEEHVAVPRSDVYGLACFHSFLIRELAPRSAESLEEMLSVLDEKGATEEELAFLGACLQPDPADRPAAPGIAASLLG